jgi:hypothetical protein
MHNNGVASTGRCYASFHSKESYKWRKIPSKRYPNKAPITVQEDTSKNTLYVGPFQIETHNI